MYAKLSRCEHVHMPPPPSYGQNVLHACELFVQPLHLSWALSAALSQLNISTALSTARGS